MNEPDRFLVLNEDGEIVNTILWDGAYDWDPGPGLTLILEEDFIPAALEAPNL